MNFSTHISYTGQFLADSNGSYENSEQMKIIFLLIIISLIVALGFLSAFLWAIKSGQYDDDYTPAVRILFEEKTNKKSNS